MQRLWRHTPASARPDQRHDCHPNPWFEGKGAFQLPLYQENSDPVHYQAVDKHETIATETQQIDYLREQFSICSAAKAGENLFSTGC